MPLVTANGCSFLCEAHGFGTAAVEPGGPDIVLIHGEIHGLEYWEHQMPAFAPKHRVLAYNRRGHAGSQMPDYGFSLVNQTRDLHALIERYGIRNPVIIAVAFGTTIAAQYALEHPDQVRALVLVAWSEMHDAMQYFHRWAGYNATAVEILEKHGRQGLIDYLKVEGGRSIYKVIPVDSPVRDKCIGMFASHPVDEYRRGMLEFGTSVPDLITPFRALKIPVLGLCGENDPYPDQPERLAGMAHFTEAPRIPGAGRFVHWEQPEAFNRVVGAFIDRISASS